MDKTAVSTPSGSALCLPCGLCCEGVLHSHALLSAEEIDLAQRLALKPMAREGGHAFALPCPLFQGTGCPTYLDRPAVCHAHGCDLLAQYLDGAIGLATAMAVVDEVKDLVFSIHKRLGETDPVKRLWQQAEEFKQGSGEEDEKFRQTHPELMRELATLKTLCRRHFNPRETKLQSTTTLA